MSPGAGAAAPTSNHTYQFVDKNITGEQCCTNYALPSVPAGPYLVTIFVRLVPSDPDIADESLACSVSDATTGAVIVHDQVTYNGEFSPPIAATATYRVTKSSKLRVGCASERAEFHYEAPLQVSFTRLDSMQTIPITGS